MYNGLNFSDYINTMLIISLRSLLRFTFNPFGVGTSGGHFPQVAPVAIHIQPLQGWGLFDIIAFPRFFLKAIISLRSLLRFTFNPFGVGALISYQQNPL